MADQSMANRARRASNAQVRPRQEVAAVVSATRPMVEDIELRSGVAPTADVATTNLYTGQPAADAQRTYFEALTSALPKYINAYRAYQAEQKKNSSSGSGSGLPTTTPAGYGTGMFPNFNTQMGVVPDVIRNTWYVTSPYGAMPYQQPAQPQDAKALLAQRFLKRTMATGY